MATIHRFFTGFAVAAAWAGAATAADATAVPDSLRACAAIRNEDARHACYDREMARLLPESAAAAATAPTPAPAVTAATAAAPLTPEQRFGLSASQADAKVTEVTEAKQLDVLEAKVSGVRPISNGRVLLDLDNGQVWRQVDTDVTVTVKPGDSVSIKKGSFGSYWLTSNGRGWRVKRLQ